MIYKNNLMNSGNINKKKKFYKRKGFIISAVIVLILILVGGFYMWKTGKLLAKVTGGGVFKSLVHAIPGVKDELKGEKEGRINAVILGMRGENVPGGGLLTDTIIVVSVDIAQNKIAMISVPRDLYVTVPGTQEKQKINAVHALGEQKGRGQGLKDMETVLSDVTGLSINYAASINFEGFQKLIDTIGGIKITLKEPFSEKLQFQEAHPCDAYAFTKPTGKYELKYYTRQNGTKYVAAQYPLCTNPDIECGGDFTLPAGEQTLNGEKALCYVRSRKTSSDFERAKRQQMIIQIVKDKLLSSETLTSFDKINSIFENLGDNVRTDAQLWEMKRVFEIYQGMQNMQIYQRVLENTEEGLLYNPPQSEAGYILLPIGNNYDRIHEVAANIFNLPPQTDIIPKN